MIDSNYLNAVIRPFGVLYIRAVTRQNRIFGTEAQRSVVDWEVRAGFMHIKYAITFFMTYMLQAEYRIIHCFHWTNLRSRNLITLDLMRDKDGRRLRI